ncbi:RNA ligase family protein [archaeon]|nr:RNA ligase family protein [archaeon]
MERYKYSRTFHLPFSLGIQSDDKIIQSLESFIGKEIVALLKMDGENTSLYSDDYMHAKSIDSPSNWTRDLAKTIHSTIRYDIPEGYRLCCENVYAKHSIFYPDNYLEGYLYLLSIWNEKNEALSWDETLIYAELLDLPTPKELYRGVFDEAKLLALSKQLDTSIEEGFVIRTVDGFHYDNFSEHVAKYVRAGHVQTDEHWLKNSIPNGIPKQPCKPAFLSQKPKKIKP